MKAQRFTVECPAYTAGPFPSYASAEACVAAVVKLDACQDDHIIVEVPDA